jgi:hypothetical protein
MGCGSVGCGFMSVPGGTEVSHKVTASTSAWQSRRATVAVLDQLLSEPVAVRPVGAEETVDDPTRLLRLSQMHELLQAAIWSELNTGADVRLMRRNLQREHVKRVVAALTRPGPRASADAAAVQRERATKLAARIKAALAGAKARALSGEARAHLAECAHLIAEALKAPLQRTAP